MSSHWPLTAGIHTFIIMHSSQVLITETSSSSSSETSSFVRRWMKLRNLPIIMGGVTCCVLGGLNRVWLAARRWGVLRRTTILGFSIRSSSSSSLHFIIKEIRSGSTIRPPPPGRPFIGAPLSFWLPHLLLYVPHMCPLCATLTLSCVAGHHQIRIFQKISCRRHHHHLL